MRNEGECLVGLFAEWNRRKMESTSSSCALMDERKYDAFTHLVRVMTGHGRRAGSYRLGHHVARGCLNISSANHSPRSQQVVHSFRRLDHPNIKRQFKKNSAPAPVPQPVHDNIRFLQLYTVADSSLPSPLQPHKTLS